MPKRNRVKEYGEGEYYHCYNRGVNKEPIFRDTDDYAYFLSLFKRYLSPEISRDATRRPYPNYADEVDLVAYCLMPNHYHLLLYLKEGPGIKHLIQSVMTAYSGYYNHRYKRTGALFEGTFLASRIGSETYFDYVSHYIHANPLDIKRDVLTYPYSSIGYFAGKKTATWIHPERIAQTEEERREYMKALPNLAGYRQLQHRLRYMLANNPE